MWHFIFFKPYYFTRKCKIIVIIKAIFMKLTTKGRYAVMAMADLASYSNKRPISLSEISIRQRISLSYLEQLFLKLKKKELVKSVRGSNGGYILVKPASEIKLSNIIFAVDEKIKTLNCKKDSRKGCNHKSVKCITHNLWDDLEQHINSFFEKVKLEDLVNKNRKQ